jgi:hypothetical protein
MQGAEALLGHVKPVCPNLPGEFWVVRNKELQPSLSSQFDSGAELAPVGLPEMSNDDAAANGQYFGEL